MKAKYFSSKVGQIFDNKEDLKKWIIQSGGIKLHYMYGNNKKCVENMKKAMQRPLLRLPLVRLQNNQSISLNLYKYIPNIDWTNIESDYDILRICKCPENKINEYIKYVKNIIDEKDKGSN